jgi:hypothetical protein
MYQSLIDRYIKWEFELGFSAVSNKEIQAFQSQTWEKTGYPHRITSQNELHRYHDFQKFFQFEEFLDAATPMTETEFKQFQNASNLIHRFVKTLKSPYALGSGKKSLLASMLYSRILNERMAFADPHGRNGILEIGPGCGYLGVLMAIKGVPYTSIEVTQALYLYQECLWRSAGLKDTCARHMAWWRVLDRDTPLPSFNTVMANRVLAEMSIECLIFYLRRIHQHWTSNETEGGLVIAQGIGFQNITYAKVFDAFDRTGFELIENKRGQPDSRSVATWCRKSDIAAAQGRLSGVGATTERPVSKGQVTAFLADYDNASLTSEEQFMHYLQTGK